MATTGVLGAVTVPVPVPVEPEPLLPVPVLVGVELRVGCRPATGCEMVAGLERRTEGPPTELWPTCARRVLRLAATSTGSPAEFAAPGLTTLTEASPREEEEEAREPALGCAVSVCVAGEPMPPSLGQPL